MSKWISAGSTPFNLVDFVLHEIGPAVLRPDGTVFAAGACHSDPTTRICLQRAHTTIYTPPPELTGTGSWVAGPNFPTGLDIADGPAALLPNGNVLVAASPGIYFNELEFLEFDGTNFNPAPNIPNAPSDASFQGRMLVLPTGQILFDDGSADVEIYISPGSPNAAWAPTITNTPFQIHRSTKYTISGTQFNGLSQGVAFGDDAQSATNYPLVLRNEQCHESRVLLPDAQPQYDGRCNRQQNRVDSI